MQAYEFHTTVKNGLIRIPEEYVKKVGPNMRVVLFPESRPKAKEKSKSRSLSDLIGVLADVGDVDLAEIKAERLRKYENLD